MVVKQIAIGIMALLLLGCASYTERYGPSGIEEKVSNYSITEDETFDQNGKITNRKTTKVPFVPDRWYSDALDKIGPMFSQLSPLIKMWIDALPAKVTPTPKPEPVKPEPVKPEPVKPEPVKPTPTPTPTPQPYPAPVTSSVFTIIGNLITLDLETVPTAMNKIGVPGGVNEMWYSLAHVYAYGPAKEMVSELAAQNPFRQQIFDWFDKEVLGIISRMKSNPSFALIAISNDGKDRCGFRLGPAIVERVLNDKAISAGRVQVGKTLAPEDY